MADLILEDFVDFSDRDLVSVLSYEKEKMFGTQKLHVEYRGANGIISTPFGDSSAEGRKGRS